MRNKTVYAVWKNGKITGIFDSAEKTPSNAEKITEEILRHSEGSPVSEGCVYAAAGEWHTLSQSGEKFEEEIYDLGYMFGVNPQSAAAALYEPRGSRCGVYPTALLRFVIDKDCSDSPPENMVKHPVFCGMFERLANTNEEGECLFNDYEKAYNEWEERVRENAEKEECPYYRMVAKHMMHLEFERIHARGCVVICGTYASKLRLRLEQNLKIHLSTEDAEILAHIRAVRYNESIAEAINSGEITRERIERIEGVYRKYFPHLIGKRMSGGF